MKECPVAGVMVTVRVIIPDDTRHADLVKVRDWIEAQCPGGSAWMFVYRTKSQEHME